MKDALVNKTWKLKLPGDRAEFHQSDPTWERDFLKCLQGEITQGDVLFDIGAECGDLSALYATWGATVVPFEPSYDYWSTIRDTFQANSLTVPALWDGFVGDVTNTKRPVPTEWPDHQKPEVKSFRRLGSHDLPTITVDEFCQRSGLKPDILVIDVEGSELLVLRGAQKTLTEVRPKLFISVHPEFMFDNYQHYENDLHSFLGKFNYGKEHISHDHEHHYLMRPL